MKKPSFPPEPDERGHLADGIKTSPGAKTKKILFVANSAAHLARYHRPMIRWFQTQGYEAHTAARGHSEMQEVDTHHELPIQDKLLHPGNLPAYRILRHTIRREQYHLVHSHQFSAGTLARIAAAPERKKGCVVLHTAHGLPFHRENRSLCRRLSKRLEQSLSRRTDAVLTMNRADGELLGEPDFFYGHRFSIHGMGYDGRRFHPLPPAARGKLRKQLDLPATAFVLINPTAYTKDQNQDLLIRTVEKLLPDCPNLFLLLLGSGNAQDHCRRLVRQRGLSDHIRVMGFSTQLQLFLQASDLCVSSAREEGLPAHLLAAQACGLPCVATAVRGHTDLLQDGKNGFLVPLGDLNAMSAAIKALWQNPSLYRACSANARTSVQPYSLPNVLKEHVQIYQSLLGTLRSRYS